MVRRIEPTDLRPTFGERLRAQTVRWSWLIVGAGVLLAGWGALRFYRWNDDRRIKNQVLDLVEKIRGLVDMEGEVLGTAPPLTPEEMHQRLGLEPTEVAFATKDLRGEEYFWRSAQGHEYRLQLKYKRTPAGKFALSKAKVFGPLFPRAVAVSGGR